MWLTNIFSTTSLLTVSRSRPPWKLAKRPRPHKAPLCLRSTFSPSHSPLIPFRLRREITKHRPCSYLDSKPQTHHFDLGQPPHYHNDNPPQRARNQRLRPPHFYHARIHHPPTPQLHAPLALPPHPPRSPTHIHLPTHTLAGQHLQHPISLLAQRPLFLSVSIARPRVRALLLCAKEKRLQRLLRQSRMVLD
jgi:hypothetical protein